MQSVAWQTKKKMRVENQNRTFNQAVNSRSFSEGLSGVRKGSEKLGSFQKSSSKAFRRFRIILSDVAENLV
jgi:hypothetical protein